MTRPASFNKTWAENVDPSQYSDESSESTQSFMNSGWEGGSDKKAPSAKTQNYMMRKVDLSLQEAERQGMLSWRSDVPYPAGARTWFHGSVFVALKDNINVEPQGSSDNQTWFLQPVSNYPATWDNISNKPETALRWPSFDEVTNMPPFRDAALYGVTKHSQINDAWSLTYDDNNLATIAQCASTRDAVNNKVYELDNSLSKVAKTSSYYDLKDTPYLSDSTNKPMRYGADIGNATEIKYEDNRIPSVAICAMLRDYMLQMVDDLNKSLNKVAKSGSYYDLKDTPYLSDSTNKSMVYGANIPNFMDLAYDDTTIPSTSLVTQLRDGLLAIIENIKASLSNVATSGNYNDLKDKPYLGDASNKAVEYGTTAVNNIPYKDDSVPSTSLLANVVKGITNPGEILSTVTAIKLGHHASVKLGEQVTGYVLFPCGTEFGYENHGSHLEGTWVCSGQVTTSDVSNSGTRTSTWVRIS